MRSTMTLYSAGSPMRVPPSFTNSAATPSFLPSSFTRTINAGGKLYSRPQRRPTFFIFVLLSGASGAASLPSASVHGVRRRSPRLGHSGAGFGDQVAHDGLQVAGFMEDAQLAVRARAFVHDRVDILNGAPAAQVVHDVVHEFEQFGNELAHGHFGFLAKVDEFSIDAVTRRAPLVFFDECAPVKAPTDVALVQAVELHNDRLGERGDRHRLFHFGGDIEHAEFEGAEGGVRAHVPPNLFAVVDAVQLDEKIYKIFVGAPGFELFGHTGARKAAEDRRAKRLEPGISAHPERRAGGERQEMREEVAHAVHHVDGSLLVGHGDVDVHAEDEQGSRELPHLFDDVLITLAGRNNLVNPARKRGGARGGDLEPGAFGSAAKLAARAMHFDAQLAHVIADARAGFDDVLVQLVLDLLSNVRRSGGEELADVRTQLARCGIDDLKFLFDTNGEAVSHEVALRIAVFSADFENQYHTPP